MEIALLKVKAKWTHRINNLLPNSMNDELILTPFL